MAFSQDLYPNSETVHKEQTVLDTSLQPYSINLFNLLPAPPQETRNLYYETGAAVKDFSRIETADVPYIERFEDMMARIREGAKPESSSLEHGAAPGAETAQPGNDTDYTYYTGYTDSEVDTEKTGRARDQSAEKPHGTGEWGGPERPRVEARGEKNRSDEDSMAGGLSLAALHTYQAAVDDVPEKAGDDAALSAMPLVLPDGEITAVNRAAPDVKADSVVSPEEGIPFTDTHPLFENKPDVQGGWVDAPIDDASVPAQDAGVMLANGVAGGDDAPDAPRLNRDPKDAISEGDGVPEPRPPLEPEAGHQFVSLANTTNDAENGARSESAAGKKKAGSRKLAVEVLDMRSGANVRGGASAEGDGAKPVNTQVPEKDITVDMKGAPLGSWGEMGDSRQIPADINPFDNAAAKNAAQFESFLSRELHNGLNGDIVRQAAVMLRDGGEGLIRLQLHPESLGNVRIRLALSGNRVEGTITVESPEAMNAFERERESLEMAFRDSGFEGASLNMQMSGGKTGSGLFDGVQAGAFSQVIAASSYESSTVTAGESPRSIYAHGGLSILA
jgi:hypothetical protein